MVPIFNKKGKTIAWLRGNELFNLKGHNVGFTINKSVYNLKSKPIGTLVKSFFRDEKGNVVAFLKDAKGGLVLPAIKISPTKPVAKNVKAHNKPSYSNMTSILKTRWSKLSWDTFILS